MISNIIYISVLIISGSITTAMVFHLWVNRKVLNPNFFLLIVIAIWLWITSQIGESIFKDNTIKLAFHYSRYYSIGILASAWLSFSIEFVNIRINNRKNIVIFLLLAGLPEILLSILIVTGNEHLFWGEITLSPNNLILTETYGPVYLVFLIYIFLILLGGITILLSFSLKKGRIQLRRQIPLILSVIIPVGTFIIDFIWHKELFYYNLMPIVLSLSSLAVIYFTRLRYFRTIPLTQHVVIESMNDTVIILGPDNRIIYINRAGYESFTNISMSDIGKPIDEISADLAALIKKAGDDQSHSEEIRLDKHIYDVNMSPIRNWKNTLISRVLVLRDISKLKRIENSLLSMKQELEIRVNERTRELKEANTALIDEIVERTKAEITIKESLNEKNILLGELHHRVKNNLQIISSLLNLQSHYLTDKKAKEVFNLSISRIRSIALIHEKLYKSENLSHTNFPDYIHDLTYYILTSQSAPGDKIDLQLDVEQVLLNIDRSILCGLIINELFTNALKHAFPKKGGYTKANPKRISIYFAALEDNHVLTISDNGKGLPPDNKKETDQTLGLKIINTLVKQLKGDIEFTYAEGTRVTIIFPKEN